MRYSLRLQEEAIFEIQEAFEFYEKRAVGLVYKLLEEILKRVAKNLAITLAITPSSAKNIGVFRPRRFPFLLIYEIEGDNVIVNGIRRNRRRPKI